MAISLTQLQTFARLAELGNFTRTAQELNVTPPAIALQIRTLSDHFGVPLIEVIKRRPVLTEAGRFLATRSQAILHDVAALERDMQRFTAAASDRLTLGATLTIGDYVLSPLLADFKARHPEIHIDVKLANPSQLVRDLRAGNVMAALGAEFPDDAEFVVTPLGDDRLVLLVPATGHRLSGRRGVRAAELASESFVDRELGAPTRTLVERELAAHDVHPRTALVLPTWEGVTRAVEAGLGIAIVSSLVAERAMRGERLHVVEIRDLDLRRQFKLITLRDATPSKRVAEFSEFVASGAERTIAVARGSRKARAAR